MKIIHIYGHSYGGNFVITQLKELKKQQHDLLVICPSSGPFSDTLKELSIDVEFIDFQGAKISDIPKVLSSVWKIRKTIKAFQAKVVHYHLIKAIIVGRLSCAFLKSVKTFSQLGGPLTLEMKVFRRLDLATAMFDDKIICSSYNIRDIYAKYRVSRHKCEVLHYAFPLDPFLSINKKEARKIIRTEFNIEESANVIGMVAYLYDSNFRQFKNVGLKGHETLIAAAKEIVNEQKNTIFLIVGQDIDGGDKYLKKLKLLVAQTGLEANFIFTGFRKDIPQLISAMDIVAVPSLSENCGGAVEPLLMKVPVVASKIGGLTDIVIENQTGWLCAPADTASLNSSLQLALNTPEPKRNDMGEQGHKLVSELFNPEVNGGKLLAIYKKTLSPFNKVDL